MADGVRSQAIGTRTFAHLRVFLDDIVTVSPEAVFLLGKDLNSFKEIAQGLQNGSPELRLGAAKDVQTREQIEALLDRKSTRLNSSHT